MDQDPYRATLPFRIEQQAAGWLRSQAPSLAPSRTCSWCSAVLSAISRAAAMTLRTVRGMTAIYAFHW